VNLQFLTNHQSSVLERGWDLEDYTSSIEWEILSKFRCLPPFFVFTEFLDLRAIRHEKVYACCVEVYLDLTFTCTVQRKPLFYIVNLIVPCVNISVLAVLVFLLPSDSKKKITLSISILVALLVFYLLLIELIPPTSLVIPLLGKYLLFTLVIVNLSIIITIITLNVHFRRHPTTHMLPIVRKILLDYLPKLLFMQRPPSPKRYVYVRSTEPEPTDQSSLTFPWKDEQRRHIARVTADHIAYIAEQIENAKNEKEVS
jgi:nicotinic acetylcholine receptor, invertebrate